MNKKIITILSIMLLSILIVACSKSTVTKPETTPVTTNTNTNTQTQTTGGNSGTVTNSNAEFDESKGFTDKNGCYDSEGGKFYEKKGYIIDAKKLRYEDNCTSERVLKEYSCGQIGYKDEESYTCDGVCRNGACIDTPVTEQCTKNDYKNYFKKGQATYQSKVYTDTCDGTNYVTEYFCTTVGILTQEKKYCSYGCTDGACNEAEPQTSTCTDTDAGVGQEFTKGKVTDPKGSIEDSCINTNTVKEWKCSNVGFRTYSNVECKNGCLDGACKS